MRTTDPNLAPLPSDCVAAPIFRARTSTPWSLLWQPSGNAAGAVGLSARLALCALDSLQPTREPQPDLRRQTTRLIWAQRGAARGGTGCGGSPRPSSECLPWPVAPLLELITMPPAPPRRLPTLQSPLRRWRLPWPLPPTATQRSGWWTAMPACRWPSNAVSSRSPLAVGRPILALSHRPSGSPPPNGAPSGPPSTVAWPTSSKTPAAGLVNGHLDRCCWSPRRRCLATSEARSWCSAAYRIHNKSWSRCSGMDAPGTRLQPAPGSAELPSPSAAG
jgi:hypothetical protein